MTFTVEAYSLDQEAIDEELERVGEITLRNIETGDLHYNAIWFDDEGNYYFCWSTGEFDENDQEILEDDLLEYHTNYVNVN